MTADARDDEAINALPAGTRFGELEILGTLGVGGFGIVYLARDHSLEREVAIKEYMPSQFASRDGRSQVSVRSVSMKETFELGRRSFVNEAKLLARFDHPSLLKVYRFWEANGTAYMAMPRLVGQNLREARKAQPTPPPEAWVRRIFDAVLGGLAILHAQQVWHRDVAPDNIFMPADGGPPILLDFGAARQAIGDRTQVFTAILKPSFAPIEQYAESNALRQGPWTDFYALAAVMHELLTGRPPPPATARAMGDELAPLQVEGYSPAFLAGLDWALRMPPQQRPQTAAAWREVLDGRADVPAAQPTPPRITLAPAPAPVGPLDIEFADTVQGTPSELDDLSATVIVPLRKNAAPPPPPSPKADKPKPPAAPPARPGAAPPRSWQGPAAIGGGVLALVLLGLFILQLRPGVAPQALPEPAASAVVAATPPAPPEAQAASVPSAAGVTQASAPLPDPGKPVPVAATRPASAPAVVAPRRDTAPKPVLTEKAGDFRPAPRSPVIAAPEPAAPVRASNTAAKPAPAAVVQTPAEPRTAGEACGSRVLFARAWCIDRQCEKPIYQNDPECVKLRELRSNRGGVP
ncbi:MAG: serine/threonine protein kinase [Roseateles sp.]|uniref:serine/threonine protein kinase n=1 Tax=Roseateles sp. TaxID=1971397 RepID=UPI004035AD0E